MTCRHDHWKPIEKWSGRYRCVGCGAVGYRGVIQASIRSSSNEAQKVAIIPYKCYRKGCDGLGVRKIKSKWVCGTHFLTRKR